jgi:hypothetical protein
MNYKIGDIVKLTYDNVIVDIVLIREIKIDANNRRHISGKLLYTNGDLKVGD